MMRTEIKMFKQTPGLDRRRCPNNQKAKDEQALRLVMDADILESNHYSS